MYVMWVHMHVEVHVCVNMCRPEDTLSVVPWW